MAYSWQKQNKSFSWMSPIVDFCLSLQPVLPTSDRSKEALLWTDWWCSVFLTVAVRGESLIQLNSVDTVEPMKSPIGIIGLLGVSQLSVSWFSPANLALPGKEIASLLEKLIFRSFVHSRLPERFSSSLRSFYVNGVSHNCTFTELKQVLSAGFPFLTWALLMTWNPTQEGIAQKLSVTKDLGTALFTNVPNATLAVNFLGNF
jgi:hypothetical protein